MSNPLQNMRNTLPRALVAALLLTGGWRSVQAQTSTRPPGQFSLQAFLTDTNGIPLATNATQNYVALFKLYNSATASQPANLLWAEQQTISVSAGYFTVLLGVGSAVGGLTHTNDLSGLFNGLDASNRFVGITIQGLTPGDPEIAPRIQLTSTAYSLLAATAVNAVNAVNATNALAVPSATYATAAGTATYATNAGLAATAGAAVYATNLLTTNGLWGVNGSTFFTSGNVSVGTNTSSTTLTLSTAPGNSGTTRIYGAGPSFSLIRPLGATNAQLNIGVANVAGQFSSSAQPNDAVIRSTVGALHLLAGSGNSAITIQTNNWVGLGDATPVAPLTCNGTVAGNYTGYETMNGGTTPGHIGNGGYYTVSFTMQSIGNMLVGGEVDVLSDARIKNIVGPTDNREDLATLLALEVTDFTYKDVLLHGQGTSKKLIAQQVESVYPRAVRRSAGALPDIYKTASAHDGWVELPTDLRAGDRVQIGRAGGDTSVYTVIEADEKHFQVREQLAAGKVLVYGREVADLRTVDYEAIAMLNLSATQDLVRREAGVEAGMGRLQGGLKLAERQGELADEQLARLEAGLREWSRPTERAAVEH